jgi:uncharacterized protein (TIGR03546 family)
MNPLKLVRKLMKAFRGGAMAPQIVLAVLLGFAVGMIPGVNLTLLGCLVLLLLLNTNGGLAGLSAMLGKGLCLLLAPVTFRIGYFLMHTAGLVGVVRKVADTPVLALLDLHVYSVLGAIPIILVVGGGLGVAVAAVIRKAQTGISAAHESSERVRKVTANPVVKFLVRVAVGKRKPGQDDEPQPLIKTSRLIAGGVVLVLIVILQLVFLDHLAREGLEAGLAQAVGAEVNIDEAHLSLAKGRLVVEGLQVTDPARPTQNQVQSDRVVADVSLGDLLAKRLVLDSVRSASTRLDVKREKPGEVYRDPEDDEPLLPPIGEGGIGSVREYLEKIKRLKEKIGQVREFLRKVDPTGEEPDPEKLNDEARLKGYLRLSAKDYLAKHPTWVVRDLQATGVVLYEDLPPVTIQGEHLASHPALYEKKASIAVRPEGDALEDVKKGFMDKVREGTGKLLGGDEEEESPEDKGDQKSDVERIGDGLKDLFGGD